MTWPVTTAPSSDSLRQAAEALAADEVGLLGVIDLGHLVGVLSERDLVRHLAEGANPDHVTVGEAMTTELVAVRPDDSVLTAAQAMHEAGVRHLPVLDRRRIVGVVSVRDVLAVLISEVSGETVVEVTDGTLVPSSAGHPLSAS